MNEIWDTLLSPAFFMALTPAGMRPPESSRLRGGVLVSESSGEKRGAWNLDEICLRQ